ncbi:protein phosphatase 2C domain-containing protein [Pseudogracilibacillus auburnensis]|nr:protein phosphatase 2C domain-containing protein [Pseudogracilibacillus auburnensis]
MNNPVEDFSWIGSQKDFMDNPEVILLNHIMIGRYGGNTNTGQYKNEDGCLVWLNENEDWEFAIMLDAHNTSESALITLELFENNKAQIKHVLSLPTNRQMFRELEEKILNMFLSDEFLSACRKITGETACLIVARKDKYVWWLSVGDCIVYLFHHELARLGQYQLNQRQFFEWIGDVNTFEQEVPCYSIGIKELRKGENHLFLATDGLIECPNELYSKPSKIFKAFYHSKDNESIQTILKNIQENNVQDNATIVSWKVNISKEASRPSNQ